MKKIIFAIVCMFLISGCAATHMIAPDRQPELKPEADKATLVIIRDTFFGGAVVFSNYLDEQFIGETKGNSYIISGVTPGPHYVVIATENTAVAHIDFQPGKIYYLREGITMGIWRARTSGFSPLTHQEASDSIKSCTYLEYDPATKAQDMDASLYKTAIDEYEADVKANPDAYKNMLDYKGY